MLPTLPSNNKADIRFDDYMKTVDIFFCGISNASIKRMAHRVLSLRSWGNVPGVALHSISETHIGCSPHEFQRERRVFSDVASDSAIYIVTDDDCVIPEGFDIQRCLDIFERSGFSVLSLMPSNCNIVQWTPENYQTVNTDEIMEHESAGGIRFCRKGHLKVWPPMKSGFPGYDAIHGKAIRAEGGRIGYFRNHKQFHLGEGNSTIWNKEAVVR